VNYSSSKSVKINNLIAKLTDWQTGVISFFIHFVLLLLLGGTVLYQRVKAPEDFTSEIGFLSEDSEFDKPAGPPELPPQSPSMPDVTVIAPPQASLSTISTTNPAVSTFQVPVVTAAVSTMATQISSNAANAAQKASSLANAGPGGGGGGGTGRGFFGVKMKANTKHVAIFLDYSGSMAGPFRAKMEKELEQFLASLSGNVQVLIIPWAGPAWMISQLGPKIAKKWKKVGDFDRFEVVAGETLDPPVWTPITPASVKQILIDTKAQVAMSGGTDWRQPFRYAMSASPQPDMIFFMTDAQIGGNQAGTLDDIRASLSKSPRKPEVNCLWIVNEKFSSTTLKALASEYKGTYKEVGGKED